MTSVTVALRAAAGPSEPILPADNRDAVAWEIVTDKPSVNVAGGLTGGGSLANDVTITLTSAGIATALNYTPANKAGDTFTGAVTISSGGLTVTGGVNGTTLSGGTLREGLTADRTYYVRTDGSDSNTGLANTAGGAFLTLQKAWDVVSENIDLKGYTATIQIADGTYTTGITATIAPVGGPVVIQGNSGTPANVLISVTSNNAFGFYEKITATIKDVEIRTTTSGDCLVVQGGAQISVSNVRFGACAGSHVSASNLSSVALSGYTITGNATYHVLSQQLSRAILSGTITLSGTPAMAGAFAIATDIGNIISTATFSGSGTGARYSAALNSVINTFGGGANYFPGNSAGATATGGQYA